MKRRWLVALIPAFFLATAAVRAAAQDRRAAVADRHGFSAALDELQRANGGKEAPDVPAVKNARAVREWSLLVYAAVDSNDLKRHAGAAIRELLETKLTERVEIVMENDAYGRKRIQRTIRRGSEPIIKTLIPEKDSADPETLAQFLQWANANAQGGRRMLLVITHAWGWKGIIQDFSLPDRPGNTMMPLPEFARVLRGWPSDILFLDSCILGNAEVLEELQDTARFVVASQRETPYNGFPYAELLAMLGRAQSAPMDVARRIPEKYAASYGRGGARAAMEDSYDVVTSVAVDMAQWRGFAPKFKALVDALRATGFREKLAADPDWPAAIADEDSNVDLYELLTRLHAQSPDPAVRSRINSLLAAIGYPEAVAQESAQAVNLNPAQVQGFEVRIEADEHFKSAQALKTLRRQWEEANLDLAPRDLHFEFQDKNTPGGGRARWLIVRGSVRKPVSLRVWLPGTQRVELALLDRSGSWSRTGLSRSRDYFSAAQFSSGSFLLGESHSQGAPFIHGVGVNMKPLMDNNEVRAEDPRTGLRGPGLYRATRWNQVTGWGDLVLVRN